MIDLSAIYGMDAHARLAATTCVVRSSPQLPPAEPAKPACRSLDAEMAGKEMNMASRRTARTAQALWEEADDLRRRLGEIVASMETALAEGGSDAKKAVEEKGRTFINLASELVDSLARDAQDAAGRTLATARAVKDEGVAELEACVRDRPLTSVAIAFGAGWLTARMTGRR